MAAHAADDGLAGIVSRKEKKTKNNGPVHQKCAGPLFVCLR